jgi:hypothetical protein
VVCIKRIENVENDWLLCMLYRKLKPNVYHTTNYAGMKTYSEAEMAKLHNQNYLTIGILGSSKEIESSFMLTFFAGVGLNLV